MDNLNFKTDVVIQDNSNGTPSMSLMNKDKKIVKLDASEIECQFDMNFNDLLASLDWGINVSAVRNSHCNLSLNVPNQTVSAKVEFDTDMIPENYLISGDGYEKYDLSFEISGIEVESGKSNPFVDDFCPHEIDISVKEIKQVDEYSFVAIVENVTVRF